MILCSACDPHRHSSLDALLLRVWWQLYARLPAVCAVNPTDWMSTADALWCTSRFPVTVNLDVLCAFFTHLLPQDIRAPLGEHSEVWAASELHLQHAVRWSRWVFPLISCDAAQQTNRSCESPIMNSLALIPGTFCWGRCATVKRHYCRLNESPVCVSPCFGPSRALSGATPLDTLDGTDNLHLSSWLSGLYCFRRSAATSSSSAWPRKPIFGLYLTLCDLYSFWVSHTHT